MQRDWELYWSTAAGGEKDLRCQVGRTLAGEPTPEEELGLLVEQARSLLGVGRHHLDLCSGNGLMTDKLHLADRVVGLDYSHALVEIAKENFQKLEFIVGSIFDLGDLLIGLEPFDRITMLESLQYFTPEDLQIWLPVLLGYCTEDVKILFQGVPDYELYGEFANTPERRCNMEEKRLTEGDPVGYWWKRDILKEIVVSCGLLVSFRHPNPRLNTSHYRFDVLMERN
ncbi:MAG: hypothetical protein DRR42_18890 [Gammaproteobacteria bacterium]|nr:MAG: hypothetical protein DRR42_18890 [Gammaproteobacteria bacterium]